MQFGNSQLCQIYPSRKRYDSKRYNPNTHLDALIEPLLNVDPGYVKRTDVGE